MTPQQKLKREIILKCRSWKGDPLNEFVEITEANVDDLYNSARSDFPGYFQDAQEEIRSGGFEETGFPTESTRHYESTAVARKCCDGSWVGWTYWHGGGKHGNPEEIDWIPDAYDVVCTVEMKPVNVFSKP